MIKPKIQILPEYLLKRIAAGEVIERPASVVKELFENSIDAGAENIKLIIQNSGLKMVQVVDDGQGMCEEDVLLCTENHATSKISKVEDLDAISTLGFRGEALASIGSVSRMSIISKTDNEEEGTKLLVEAGKIVEVQKVATTRGTSIIIKDIFGNIPARRKFLKTPSTELRNIIAVFRRIALCYSEIHFTLLIDGDKSYELKKETFENRLKSLLGDEKYNRLTQIEYQSPHMKISGFISKPGEYLKSRSEQYFFLNHRFIVNRSLIHSVLSAYQPIITKNQYPMYILFIEMDSRWFDVNVHPTKIEVRFSDEKYIHDMVHRAVKEGLRSSNSIPEFHLIKRKHKTKTYSMMKRAPSDNCGQLTLEVQRPLLINDDGYKTYPTEISNLWQIHNRYILSKIKSGITIIDQHTAHERILFERAVRSRNKQGSLSQQLLFPQTLELNYEDQLILTEILPYLEKIGFGIKDFGRNTVVIESVPVEVKTGRESELLLEIIEEYRETKQETSDIQEAVAKAFACKSAIKSGEHLTLQEMASLIDQLFATSEPYHCPHGRPVVINLTLEEIDKRFGR